MNIVFEEHKPEADLASFVQSYWFGDFNLASVRDFSQSVVPNGCVELIIHLSDDHCALPRGRVWSSSPAFTLLGLHMKPDEVRFSNRVNVFGIRFHPDGIRNVFGVPPAAFRSTYEDGVDVLGETIAVFCEQVREASTDRERLVLTNQFIRSQLDTHFKAWDYTHQAMLQIRAVAGHMSYGNITSQIPISERQLQREFKQQYGITMGDYMRLARMNAIYHYMQMNNRNLTQLSNELDFFDQAHFIREFKTHVGIPPGKFSRNRDQFIVNPAARIMPI